MTVEIDGANNIIKTNTINEVSSANGVTVDSLSIKDGKLVTADSVIEANMSANSVDSDSYVDASIDAAHLNSNVITGQTALTSVANDDLVLLSDTSGSAALKKMTVANLVANAGGGKLLQTQQALFTSQSAHNTDSYTASNYTDQITPSATNSKIFVQFNFRSHIYQSSGNSAFSRLAIFRQINGGGFSQFFPNVADVCWGYNGDGSAERTFYSQPQISFIDTTHNTTTAIDYTLYASRNTSSSGNVNIGGSNHQAQVILMEISA